MASYSPLVWHDFFVGTIGASAALTGLLFVAFSINSRTDSQIPPATRQSSGDPRNIGEFPGRLWVRAGTRKRIRRPLGIEIAAVGAAVAGQALWVTHGKQTSNEPKSWVVEHLVTLLLPSITFIVGGVSLAVGEGGGLYWVLAATLFVFVSASINGWVLLVEIKR